LTDISKLDIIVSNIALSYYDQEDKE